MTQNLSNMHHRRWALAGFSAAFAVGLGGWAFLRQGTRNNDALQAFWSLHLPRPDGSTLNLEQLRGQYLLVNFWATWCAPCVHEMPLLNQFAKQQSEKGNNAIRVLGVAVDQPAAVTRWLHHKPIDFPVVIAGPDGVAISRGLGNIQGGLPFTLLFDAQGCIQQRKIGQISEKDLVQWASLN